MFWEKAPDHRTSRTLDWLNDACEAKLGEEDRRDGEVTYRALMSPVSIAASSAFDWRHPFSQVNRARLPLGKKEYTGKFPISLLLTERTDAGKPEKVPPYVLLGTKKLFGRRAAVGKYTWDEIDRAAKQAAAKKAAASARDQPEHAADTPHGQAKPKADGFLCTIHISTFTIDVRFATEFEAKVLREFLSHIRTEA